MRRRSILFLLILLVGFGGCDFLNYDESSTYEEGDVFTNFDRVKAFLSNIYAGMPQGFNAVDGAMRASASDESEEGWEFSDVQKMNNGSWSAVQLVDPQWESNYTGIRAVNRFLAETQGQTFEDRRFNDNYAEIMLQFDRYPYEARFLRAYFYFELIKRYGGVPLITEVLDPAEANAVARASFDEVADFIVAELDTVAAHLPVTYTSEVGQETGRATRGAAMALKARLLLYAASPLHNQSGDATRWIEAARASKALIDSSWYRLEDQYANAFNNRTSVELILDRREGATNSFERANIPVGFEGATVGGTRPTQNLVDQYEMQRTGLDIDEEGSGFDPDRPYHNRDPRLYATVIFNGLPFKGEVIETFRGGVNGLPKQGGTETGYYLKKYLIEDVSLDPSNTTTREHTWVLFRFGEVLLNYAEAMNEAYGPDNGGEFGMTALQAVNRIRQRAKIGSLPAGLTKEQLREELRQERMIELAFEDHRFWDVRRWMILPQTTDIYGVNVTKLGFKQFQHDYFLLESRAFDEAMYYYPIPQAEIFKNPNLTQNPGW